MASTLCCHKLMVLVIDELSRTPPKDLLAKIGRTGQAQVRGPLIAGPWHPNDKPLATLTEGSKLHVVAGSELTSDSLLQTLLDLGLKPDVRLRQIHLLIDNGGLGGITSLAERLSTALTERGFQVDEIKAPRGRVRWDTNGKVHVCLTGQEDWQPSGPALNYYTGPAVLEKHRG
jgi:hypothetical protein